MRVGTIDIGTNTVLLLVAAKVDGTVVAIEEHMTITRLGQGVDKTRKLAADAIARTTECLARYAAHTKRAGVEKMDIVGTSAMRDAEGGGAIVEACRDLFGVPARVLGGDEEAQVTFRGALSGIRGLSGEVAVFDIGGGSTEIVVGGRGIAAKFSRSFDVGSVRMTERVGPADPPSEGDLARLRELAETLLEGAPKVAATTDLVGIAGTMTTIAAVHMGLTTYDGARVHGATLTADEIRDTIAKLARMPLDARGKVAGLEPKRADVIVAGGILATVVLEKLGKTSVRISDRGVRWGLAEALLEG